MSNSSHKPKTYESRADMIRSAHFEQDRAAAKVAAEQKLAAGTVEDRLHLLGQLWGEKRLQNGHSAKNADMLMNDASFDPIVGMDVIGGLKEIQYRINGAFADHAKTVLQPDADLDKPVSNDDMRAVA